MEFKQRSLMQIATLIGGGTQNRFEKYFKYRSSSFITEFFSDCDTDYSHDGSSRLFWIADTLAKILNEPHSDAKTPPDTFARVIQTLMDQGDAEDEGPERPGALAALNAALTREGFAAFYGEDKKCYLRHIATNTIAQASPNPHKAFSEAERKKRDRLAEYLGTISEDQLIEEILMPLFRQLGFHRITVAGHKDKLLEYGKDIWMKFTLPTTHVLYFGIQAKKGKIDSAGVSNGNIGEIYNQVSMMLGHEIFDPEVGRSVLVDHAFIVAGGEITKLARNWLGGKLDAVKRSQIMFMDREDILNLYAVTSLPLPVGALPKVASPPDDDLPF